MPPGVCRASLSSSGSSEAIAPVVNMRPAIEAAFCNAVRVTLAGSITPALTRSSYTSVCALKPEGLVVLLRTNPLDNYRAFFAGVLNNLRSGSRARDVRCLRQSARQGRLRPSLLIWNFSSTLAARTSATPPPGTIPSSTAARVRALHPRLAPSSPSSPSQSAAPTLIMRHRRRALQRLEVSRDRSPKKSLQSGARRVLTRPSMSLCLPAPSTMVVLSCGLYLLGAAVDHLFTFST